MSEDKVMADLADVATRRKSETDSLFNAIDEWREKDEVVSKLLRAYRLRRVRAFGAILRAGERAQGNGGDEAA